MKAWIAHDVTSALSKTTTTMFSSQRLRSFSGRNLTPPRRKPLKIRLHSHFRRIIYWTKLRSDFQLHTLSRPWLSLSTGVVQIPRRPRSLRQLSSWARQKYQKRRRKSTRVMRSSWLLPTWGASRLTLASVGPWPHSRAILCQQNLWSSYSRTKTVARLMLAWNKIAKSKRTYRNLAPNQCHSVWW